MAVLDLTPYFLEKGPPNLEKNGAPIFGKTGVWQCLLPHLLNLAHNPFGALVATGDCSRPGGWRGLEEHPFGALVATGDAGVAGY